MLTILRDPGAITGRERHPWDFTISMQANVERHLVDGGHCTVRLNGEAIDPITDARMDAAPTVLDELIVVERPGDPGTAGLILLGSLAATVLIYAAMPRVVPAASTDAVGKDSPNNRLTGQTNVARAYQAVPDVYGYRRVWPDLLQPSVVEYIDNVKYVTEWLCVSRGKGTITDLRYSETPITDVDGATHSIFLPASSPNTLPELNSTTLTNVIEAFASDDVNGQELPYAVSTVPAQFGRWGDVSTTIGTATFTFSAPDSSVWQEIKDRAGTGNCSFHWPELSYDVEATVDSYVVASGVVTFTFTAISGGFPDGAGYLWAVTNTFPNTLVYFQPLGAPTTTTTTVGPFTLPTHGTGIRYNIVFLRGLKGTVQIRAEWWKIDGSGAEISGTRQHRDDSFSADTYDQQFFTRTVWPSGGDGKYRVEFTRLNAESGDGSDVAKLEEVYALRKYATKVLPGVTVVRVTTKATEQATGISERKFNLRWQRHVRTLASETVSASRNFARAMAHVWTLAGEDMAQLDTTALTAINTDLGETSPLLRFDGSFDDADLSLGERLQRIAYHVRGVVWRDGTKWTVTREQAKVGLVPEVQFDYRNLASGGESTVSYSAHLPASHDGIELEYVDEDTQAKKAYVRLSIASGSVATGTSQRPLKISMSAGCTTLEQANNRAQLEARRLLYQRTSVSDTALQDAAELGVGSLCRWVDPHDFQADDGLQAGEVIAISGSTITLSEAVDFKAEASGRVVFTGVDGTPVSSPVVCTPGANDREIVLASVPAGLYLANGTTQQASSRYCFAVGVSDAELEAAGLFVMTTVAPASDRTYSIALANYDDRLFEAD